MKKWIILLCFLLIASVVVPQSQVKANTGFTDIGTSHRAHAEINFLLSKGIVSGFSATRFAPAEEVTRGQAATMIGRALNLNGTPVNTRFPDLKAGNKASGYVEELVKKGVISGYSDGTFGPGNVLKRGEMALMIQRAYNLGGADTVNAAAQKLLDLGIAQGMSNGSFGISETIIRADFSIFLARTINTNFRIKSDSVNFNTTMYVNAGSSSTLNMRSGAGTTFPIISRLANGQAVSVATTTGDWSHIKVNNVIGFVHKAYLQSVKPGAVLPSPPPAAGSDLTVIFDPGHGGSDPGGTGNGFMEKNVVLNIANHSKKYFDRVPINLKMTRTTDVFVPLTTRAKFAQNNGGNIFVSLHTNAFNSVAQGHETFYYARTAATNPKVNESRALAIYLQARMLETWPLKNRGVNPFGYGNFAVLRENTVPAALIEMGFIDSSVDIQYIRLDSQRERMGKALFLATLDYFYHYEGRTDLLQHYSTVSASPSKRLH